MYRIRYTVLLDGEEYPSPSCSSKFPFKGKPGVLWGTHWSDASTTLDNIQKSGRRYSHSGGNSRHRGAPTETIWINSPTQVRRRMFISNQGTHLSLSRNQSLMRTKEPSTCSGVLSYWNCCTPLSPTIAAIVTATYVNSNTLFYEVRCDQHQTTSISSKDLPKVSCTFIRVWLLIQVVSPKNQLVTMLDIGRTLIYTLVVVSLELPVHLFTTIY